MQRPRLVALNKLDVPEARDLAELVRPEIEARGLPVYEISAVSHAGLSDLSFALARAVAADREQRPAPSPARIVLRPRAVDEAEFSIERTRDGFVVHGAKPERWITQTAFDNDEAVGYLADRLARLGVEQELARLGAEPGDAVTIGTVTFDFEPTAGVDEDYTPTRRGTDERLSTSTRVGSADRLAAKKARRRSDDAADATDHDDSEWDEPERDRESEWDGESRDGPQ